MADTTITTPVAGSTPSPELAPKKPRGETRPGVFKTLAEAMKEAESRAEGHRRVFTVKLGASQPDQFVIANHPHQAAALAALHNGGLIDEQGKVSRSRPLTSEQVLAAVQNMPEAERKAILDALKPIKAK